MLNKISRSGKQITIVLHVDDLFVTCEESEELHDLDRYLKSNYNKTKSRTSKVIDFVGMTFDFTQTGSVKVTMDNCTDDILKDCGVTEAKATPAASIVVRRYQRETAQLWICTKRIRRLCAE